MLNHLGKKILDILPKDSSLILKAANYYLDLCNGDNNVDLYTNGEARLINSLISELNKNNAVIFDVGANVGEWSRNLIRNGFSSELHMFEPSTITFQKLKSLSWSDKVFLNNFGMSENTKSMQLQIFDECDGMNSLYIRKGINRSIIKTEDVKMSTIDEYCSLNKINFIDFLKVDVEGHEFSVLNGANRFLQGKKIGMIQFEYGGCNLDARAHLSDIWELLSAYDYSISKILPDRIKFYEEYDQKLENFKYSNWLAKLNYGFND